jgi:hypothetical protein
MTRGTPPEEGASLRQVLEGACNESGCNLDALTVLSEQNDPYRLDSPAWHRDGAWLAAQLERAVGSERRIHWRGLHYAIVAAGDIEKPNGETYRNTHEDWRWLSEAAGKAARWLGYVDFERIIDNRNSDPIIYRKPKASLGSWISAELEFTLPAAEDIEPFVGVSGFEGRQPYALAIFGEKASLAEVLLPLAQRYEADLYLPSGEISDTLLYRMARDAFEDGRPLAVFVLSDFDPSGSQMAVSIGRKLQALRDLKFPAVRFEVVPVALNAEQVRQLGLPSTPLKETERRADKWRAAFGVEQTEIDALATLQPRVLSQIVRNAIKPYFDETLAGRVAQARIQWREDAQQALDEQIDDDALAVIRERAAIRLEELEAELEAINEQLRIATDGVIDLPEPVIPEPEIDDEGARQPLVSSDWDWAEATRALKDRKTYGNGT